MPRSESDEGKLGSIEKLLVLGLIRGGMKQAHVAAALGMHRTSLSRSFPNGLLAEVARVKGGGRLEADDGQ